MPSTDTLATAFEIPREWRVEPLSPSEVSARYAVSQRDTYATASVVSYEVKAGRRWIRASRVFINHDDAQRYAKTSIKKGVEQGLYRKVEVHSSFVF